MMAKMRIATPGQMLSPSNHAERLSQCDRRLLPAIPQQGGRDGDRRSHQYGKRRAESEPFVEAFRDSPFDQSAEAMEMLRTGTLLRYERSRVARSRGLGQRSAHGRSAEVRQVFTG